MTQPYKTQEYYSVIQIQTGRKLVDCGDITDAMNFASLDGNNRRIIKNKTLMSDIINVELPKELPTSNITVTNIKENGCAPRKEQLLDASLNKLPDSQLQPIIVN